MNEWRQILQKGEMVYVVYFDFQKDKIKSPE